MPVITAMNAPNAPNAPSPPNAMNAPNATPLMNTGTSAASAARLALALPRDRTTIVAGGVLALVVAAAWVGVVQQASMGQMEMAATGGPGMRSAGGAAAYLAAWGVMMAAMMLPSAIPMIALYGLISRRRSASGGQAVPTALFAGVYLGVWLLTGVPVYLAGEVFAALPGTDAWLPYGVAAALVAAGAYQFTAFKRICLRKCQTPLSFIMPRWRSGYVATLRLGLAHALYCLGCCWGLMLVLVAAGAMSLPWVLLISALVFAEKLLPFGGHTARAAGVLLIVAGVIVAAR